MAGICDQSAGRKPTASTTVINVMKQQNQQPKPVTQLNVAMISFSYYPADVRVRREAETLATRGFAVDMICLRDKQKDELPGEKINNVIVHRVNLQRKRKGKYTYLYQYGMFIIRVFFLLNWLDLKNKYDAIYVHNMPDVLVFCALLQKLKGIKIILDVHDPVPEIFMTKFKIPGNHFIIRLLCRLEKWSFAVANVIITTNLAFRDVFVDRGCAPEKIHIIMNTPNDSFFQKVDVENLPPKTSRTEVFRLMYHGTIIKRHGLLCALQALDQLRNQIPQMEFHVYGRGEYVNKFIKHVQNYSLSNIVTYHGAIPNPEIAVAIAASDLGIIPNLKTPFTEINFPVRIFEYLSLNCPVIVPDSSGIRDYFSEDDIHYFEAGNAENLAAKILEIYLHPDRHSEILSRGRAVYKNNTWRHFAPYFVYIITATIAGEQPKQNIFVPDPEHDSETCFFEKTL